MREPKETTPVENSHLPLEVRGIPHNSAQVTPSKIPQEGEPHTELQDQSILPGSNLVLVPATVKLNPGEAIPLLYLPAAGCAALTDQTCNSWSVACTCDSRSCEFCRNGTRKAPAGVNCTPG